MVVVVVGGGIVAVGVLGALEDVEGSVVESEGREGVGVEEVEGMGVLRLEGCVEVFAGAEGGRTALSRSVKVRRSEFMRFVRDALLTSG